MINNSNVLGTAASGKFLFSGSRQLRESNHRQLSWRGEAVQHIFRWGCLLQGAGHAVGTKPRIHTGLLADGPGRALRPALCVEPG